MTRMALLLIALVLSCACQPEPKREHPVARVREAPRPVAAETTLIAVGNPSQAGAIERGSDLGIPFVGPQPRHSPGVRVQDVIDGVEYDVAPEVQVRMDAVAMKGQFEPERFDAELQAQLPWFVFDDQGRVAGAYVRALVDSQGTVGGVTLLVTDTSPFARSIVEAAKQWRFEPARMKGRPVPVWVYFVVMTR